MTKMRAPEPCRLCGDPLPADPWDHMLTHIPPEDPARLRGPEVGTRCIYQSPYTAGPERVEVVERSYVWAPGDPGYGGGVRRYDVKVIRFVDGTGTRTLSVDDRDLVPVVA